MIFNFLIQFLLNHNKILLSIKKKKFNFLIIKKINGLIK